MKSPQNLHICGCDLLSLLSGASKVSNLPEDAKTTYAYFDDATDCLILTVESSEFSPLETRRVPDFNAEFEDIKEKSDENI